VALRPEDEIFRVTLPPGRHRLPRDFVARHQRERLYAAIAKLVDEQGYPAVSLTQIVKTAGIARHTFYEHFEDKEALYLSLFDRTAERVLDAMAKAMDAEPGPWEAKLRAGLAAFLARVAGDPALTRVVMFESLSAGRAALARRNEALQRLGEMLKQGRKDDPRGEDLTDSLEDILLGGAAWMVNRRLIADEDDVEGMLPELLEFLVAPYRGNAAARELARGATSEDPGRRGD
jgi:AcrR family transcriptional regulator